MQTLPLRGHSFQACFGIWVWLYVVFWFAVPVRVHKPCGYEAGSTKAAALGCRKKWR